MTTLIINIRKLATEDTVLFPKIRDSLPEKSTQKDYHLRPPRLRRSSAGRHARSSGEHALPGVEIVGAVCLPTSAPLVGARRLGRQPPPVIRSSANFFMTLLVRLFFLDYFSQNGNHGGRVRYKFTGSAQYPKDAVQIRFAAWERRGLSSNKGKHRCDEVVSSSVMIFGTIDFFARIYSNNQPI